ncbi:MAG: putative 4-mercaptohistidine N1-methyltransferase [Thermodesulfobacteriota bacterium]|nr:putative 4-mercaptohistidine N1-methyltransferase [Thermodesulfobacteriota bacterium]
MIKQPILSQSSNKSVRGALYARYHSDSAISQYCDAHYGPDKFGVANFPKRMVQLCITALEGKPQRRALDLGCAVGRTSFELATYFDQVTGIDFSSRFIDIARRIQKRGKICYQLPEEGELISDHEVLLTEHDLADTASKVTFSQGNARYLETRFCDYDLVLAANLIDRCPEPRKFLAGIHKRLVLGGLLVIASPYNWLEHYTPRKQWLGGRFRVGTPFTSLEGLEKKLSKHFIMIGEPQEVEFVIRETARTFHHNISQVTLWRRIL